MKTHPIKDKKEIEMMEMYFLEKGEWRNYTLFVLGINTSLRISDLLKLKWKDVYDFSAQQMRKHLHVLEQKTQKWNYIALNENATKCLLFYMQKTDVSQDAFIFKSKHGLNRPINRNQAYLIIKNAATELGLSGNISCHSLRKTFGYHAWRQGVPPAVIMDIYNHSNMNMTKIYLSIDQDEKDEVFYSINL